MPKCKNCGSEIQDGDIFCGYCGTRVEAVTETPQPAPEGQTQQAAPMPQQAHAETPRPVQVQPVVLKKVTLKSPLGETKSVDVGYCRWMPILGSFVCLYRKDFKMFFILTVVFILCSYLSEFILSSLIHSADERITMKFGLIGTYTAAAVASSKYNRIYIKGLIAKGWRPDGPDDYYTLTQLGIMPR